MRSLFRRVLGELEELDVAVYEAVEATPTPTIDVPLRALSNAADHAGLYLGIAAVLFALGGPNGRRAAVTGLAAVGLDSFVVNVPMKLLGKRPRPVRGRVRIAEERHVRMPSSSSFSLRPSASGFAFAAGAAEAMPQLGIRARVARRRRLLPRSPAAYTIGRRRRRVVVGMAAGRAQCSASRAVRRRSGAPVAARPLTPEAPGGRGRRPHREGARVMTEATPSTQPGFAFTRKAEHHARTARGRLARRDGRSASCSACARRVSGRRAGWRDETGHGS